jgi:hypothetical protein
VFGGGAWFSAGDGAVGGGVACVCDFAGACACGGGAAPVCGGAGAAAVEGGGGEGAAGGGVASVCGSGAGGGQLQSPWADEGWDVYLDSAADVRRAVNYVEDNPGKEGKPRQRWSFVAPFEV